MDRGRAIVLDQQHQPLALSLKWFKQVFLDLEHLHLANMQLRDLKPRGVVLDAQQRSKPMDLGCGCFGAEALAVWSFDFRPGSHGYISPEITAGKRSNFSADHCSLVVVMWLVFTGGTVSSGYIVGGPFSFGTTATPPGDVSSHGRDFETLRWSTDNPGWFAASPLPTLEANEFVPAQRREVPSKHPTHQQVCDDAFFAKLSNFSSRWQG